MRSNRFFIFACIVWLSVISSGLFALARYASTPGAESLSLDQWPSASLLHRAADRDSLVMFVHPQCPCTSAGMEELNQLIGRCGNKLAITVVFVQPAETTEDWTKTTLWAEASALPGVTVCTDVGGAEAQLFDASTSGQTFLFSRSGKVLFKGGITAGRGHAGDNAGIDAINLLVNGLPSSITLTPVFGCELQNGDSRKAKCPR